MGQQYGSSSGKGGSMQPPAYSAQSGGKGGYSQPAMYGGSIYQPSYYDPYGQPGRGNDFLNTLPPYGSSGGGKGGYMQPVGNALYQQAPAGMGAMNGWGSVPAGIGFGQGMPAGGRPAAVPPPSYGQPDMAASAQAQAQAQAATNATEMQNLRRAQQQYLGGPTSGAQTEAQRLGQYLSGNALQLGRPAVPAVPTGTRAAPKPVTEQASGYQSASFSPEALAWMRQQLANGVGGDNEYVGANDPGRPVDVTWAQLKRALGV